MKPLQWIAVFSLSALISFGMAALYAKYFDSGVRFITITPSLPTPIVEITPTVDHREQIDVWCDASGLHVRAPAGAHITDVRCPPK